MKYEKLKDLEKEEFKRYCGVSVETFAQIIKVVKAEKILQKKSGRPSKLTIENQILLTLNYLREYRSFFHIAKSWDIHESTAHRIIMKMEKILMNSGLFNLIGKKGLREAGDEIEVIVVDVSEHEIERPEKKQKKYYSGKQGYHTIKSQLLVNKKSAEIICVSMGKGSTHDFTLFKESEINLNEEIEFLADKGYQGIKKMHENSRTPIKKRKNNKLSKEEKEYNSQLAKERVIVENIHRCLKIFRILSSRYRNRRKRFGLRLNLIAGIYNYELSLQSKLASS